tara:strand:- start:6305 stop:7426 length:1122 start_codon:yes stop_codon:yes gene_type:complete
MQITRNNLCRSNPISGAVRFLLALVLCFAGGVQAADSLAQPAPQSAMAPNSLMLDVTAAGERLVAVGERGYILLSDDDGHSWRQAPSPVSVTLTRLYFVDSQYGWAVGHGGVVLHSKDGGATWSKQLDGVEAAQVELEAASAMQSVLPGQAADRRRSLAQRLVEEGADKPLLAVHFFDRRSGVVVGAYGLALSTQDGGNSWHSITDRLDNPMALHLYSFLDVNGTYFIAGEQGLLLRSEDHGASYTALDSPASGTIFGLLQSSPRGVLAYGLRGKAYLSEDRGASWTRVANNQPVTITAGTRLGNGELILVDETGRTLVSKDAGRSLNASSLAEPTYLTGLTVTPDGALAISSVRGVLRLPLNELNGEKDRDL